MTTAVRVFALALAAGLLLGTGWLVQSAAMLAALVIVALAASAAELGALDRRAPWIPVTEGALVGILLATPAATTPLLVYLAVPPVVAGVRHGWVATTNAALLCGAALVGTVSTTSGPVAEAVVRDAAAWWAVGLGGGLLAGWQTRSLRRLEEAEQPWAEARDLVAQLHALTTRAGVGLDSPTAAEDLAASLRAATVASASAVFLTSTQGDLELFAGHGRQTGLLGLGELCLTSKRPVHEGTRAAVLLRAHGHTFGALALRREQPWSVRALRDLQARVDRESVRLETALLFDDVRELATAEERNRLAREIHDGVAQEIVGLGYVVDELESAIRDPEARAVAAGLRDQITRIVGELRFSVFDLRHEVADQRLSGALAEYVRMTSAGTGLRVHLLLDEKGPPLPRRTEAELLRIAQEAITNVRKHARAVNLWVSLVTDGSSIRLRIEDDGVGGAACRDGHYGLHTMRERAERVGARLSISPRPDGGTMVSLRSPSLIAEERSPREHDSLAGR